MNIKEVATLVQDDPIFESSIFRVVGAKPTQISVQLVRWVKSGAIIQLRRGLYVLGTPYRKRDPHAFLIANHIQRASYVSFQSALSHYGMIPEYVPVVTSATRGRPGRMETELGWFIFRHLREDLFTGFEKVLLMDGQTAVMARPEKALVDLLYLTPGCDAPGYAEELRLQNTEGLDITALQRWADLTRSAKVKRAVRRVVCLLEAEKGS